MPNTNTRNTKPLNNIGDTIVVQLGRITITLQWVAVDEYTITTMQGTTRVGEWCETWTDEATARDRAYMIASLYNDPANYVWPCGCGDVGWIDAGNGVKHPCKECNKDGGRQ